jgi:ankyrin repeat protein
MFNLGKRCKLIVVYICAIIFSLSGFAVAESLHDAAKEGDLAKVKSLITEGSDVNIADENGTTPLHFAADRGHIDVVELLISKGADVNAETKRGFTPLHWAAQQDHKDVVELLISKGADVNAETKRGFTPLHGAARTGDKDLVELLISKGANVNANKFRYTPIAWTGVAQPTDSPEIVKARKEVIELLRRHGAQK